VDIPTLAGVDTAGIGRNHPFVVGNQRTGFIVGFLFLELNFLELNFLELNGCRFTAGEEDAAEALLALAAGESDESGFTMF